MAVRMIEGFEQIDTSIEMTAEQFQYLFLACEPDATADWFASAGDSVQHVADGRVGGNCLRFSRGANAGAAWSRKWGANLGFPIIPKQVVGFGWATRYSEAPLLSIPLLVLRYDNGLGEQEQLSLWATPDAKLFISNNTYNADFDALTASLNPLGSTAAGAFRFTQWTYFEILVNYVDDDPVITVMVNGEIVLDAISDASFRQLDEKFISSIHIINPTNGHFDGAAVWQDVDDVYYDDEQLRGPQWIVGLENGASVTNEGWTGVPPDTYTGIGGVSADDYGDSITWELSNPPALVGTVTAIGVNLIGSQSEAIDTVGFGVIGSSTSRSKKGSISAGSPTRCLRYVTEGAPTGTSMTGPGLNALKGYLLSSQVIY